MTVPDQREAQKLLRPAGGAEAPPNISERLRVAVAVSHGMSAVVVAVAVAVVREPRTQGRAACRMLMACCRMLMASVLPHA